MADAEEAVAVMCENLPEGAEAGETCGLLQPAAEGDVEVYLDGAVGLVLGVVIQITEGFQLVTNQIIEILGGGCFLTPFRFAGPGSG